MSSLILINSILLYFAAILCHEAGHLIALKNYGYKMILKPYYYNWRRFGFKTGDKKDYIFMPYHHRIGVGVLGVVCGLFPILFIGFWFNHFYLLMIAPYLTGCFHDIEIIIEELKKNDFFNANS